MKKIICFLLVICMIAVPCVADGDPNIDGSEGDNMGSGTGQSVWHRGDEGVRVTIIDDRTNRAASRSVDFANKKQTVKYYFGYHNKLSYYQTKRLIEWKADGGYNNIVPTVAFPNIIPRNGQNNIEAIKRYFSDAEILKTLAQKLNFQYADLVSGDYVLLLEPMVYMTYNGFRYAMTATEAGLLDVMTHNDLAAKMGALTHCNLPRSMYLSKPALGILTPRKPFERRSNNAQIIDALGIGTVSFKPEKPPVLPSGELAYHTDTDVITSVMIYADREYNPDDMGRVTFNILGRSYTKYFVCPDGEEQLVWVRWHTPTQEQDIEISIEGNAPMSLGTIRASIIEPKEIQPPDPQFEDAAPEIKKLSKLEHKAVLTHRWTVWTATEEYIKPTIPGMPYESVWEFNQSNYWAELKTTAAIIPDPRVQTEYSLGYGNYEMKSGYGVDIELETKMMGWYSDYDVTGVQNAEVKFPEFEYKTYNRLLEQTSERGKRRVFGFKQNKYSYYLERVHFTPLRYPDNKKYTVTVDSFDCWTPVGELRCAMACDNITINGNIYDDYYVRPIRE